MTIGRRKCWAVLICLVLVGVSGCTAHVETSVPLEEFVSLEVTHLPSDWQVSSQADPLPLDTDVEAYMTEWQPIACSPSCFAGFRITAKRYQSSHVAAKAFRASVRRLRENGTVEQTWEDCSHQADQCILLVNKVQLQAFLIVRYSEIVVLAALFQTNSYQVTDCLELFSEASADFEQLARGSPSSPDETPTTPTATW